MNRGVRPIVCGADGQPIPNATVVIYSIQGIYQTDASGGVTVELPTTETDICVKVQGIPGYDIYLQSPLIPATNVNLGIGTPVGPTDVQLPPLNPKTPPHSVVQVKAGFCNLHDSKIVFPSPQGRPIFSPYFMCLPANEQEEWITLWRAAKMTHVAIMTTSPIYPEGLPQYAGAFYPAPAFDPSPAQFANATSKLLVNGLTPTVFATNGAYPTDLAAFRVMVQSYLKPFANQILTVEGWEPYWTNDQHAALYAILREELGPAAKLALHLPSNYIDNGNGDADWADNGPWSEVDVFLMELAPPQSAADIATMGAGWQQCIQRIIPTPGVDYRFANRSRPVTPTVFEQVAYFQIRDEITDADINTVMAWNIAQGIPLLGNANGF